jgi:hypothetical protein
VATEDMGDVLFKGKTSPVRTYAVHEAHPA